LRPLEVQRILKGQEGLSTRNAVPVQGIADAAKNRNEGSPEVALNQKVKALIQKLGEAIHESVSESEHIAGVVQNIREQGFDVMLMLEATIGLNEVDTNADERGETQEGEEGVFTSNDLSFLKSLRITLPDEDEPLSLGDGESGSGPDS